MTSPKIGFDTKRNRTYITTSYGKWYLSEHSLERLKERLPNSTIEELQNTLENGTHSLLILDGDPHNKSKNTTNHHVLFYHKGIFFVAIVAEQYNKRSGRLSHKTVTTFLTEDIYRKQTYAVNLSLPIQNLSLKLLGDNKLKPQTGFSIGPLQQKLERERQDLENGFPEGWWELGPNTLKDTLSEKQIIQLINFLIVLPEVVVSDRDLLQKKIKALKGTQRLYSTGVDQSVGLRKRIIRSFINKELQALAQDIPLETLEDWKSPKVHVENHFDAYLRWVTPDGQELQWSYKNPHLAERDRRTLKELLKLAPANKAQ